MTTIEEFEEQPEPAALVAIRDDLMISNPPEGGWAGWAGPLLATAVGATLRLPNLGTPHALIFDETYYVKDGLSLLKFGYERKAIEGADEALLSGSTDIFQAGASYVVHPPLGKWIIALGEHLFGATPFGWRILMAVLGIASILVTARVARRLTHSNVIGTTAGFLLALDGLHITMSRTALLDTPLSFFIICAFACLIIDRDHTRLRSELSRGVRFPRVWMTIFLGLAVATKWSGLYFALAFGMLMLHWDWRARQERSEETPAKNWLVHDFLPSLLMPITIVGIYLSSWIGWFRTSGGWNRNWGGDSFLPQPLAALWHYHHDMYNFHTSLTSDHSYKANPLGWPLMIRPTSFFYETAPTCGTDNCSQEVIPLGNPMIWWGGAIALIFMAVLMFRRRHPAALPIVVAFLAGWAPWVYYIHRTTFTFYSVVYIPFTVIALALALHLITHRRVNDDSWNWQLIAAIATVALLTAFFYPILVGQSLPYNMWQWRMWLPSWV